MENYCVRIFYTQTDTNSNTFNIVIIDYSTTTQVLDTQVSLEPVQAAEETMPSAVTPEKHLDEHTGK